MIRMLGAMVGGSNRGCQFVGTLVARLVEAQSLRREGRVFFEEWDDPLVKCHDCLPALPAEVASQARQSGVTQNPLL
jgi:hypothetical protein